MSATVNSAETAVLMKDLSPGALARRRFLKNKTALVGSVFLLLVVLATVLAPIISPFSPDQIDLTHIRQAPSSTHLLGTDSTGRDVFSRLLYGGQVSLTVGFLSALIAVAIGTTVGTFAGWFGGVFDAIVSRIIDLMLAIPVILVVIVLAGVIGPNVTMLIVVIAVIAWPSSARISRGVVMGLREQEFAQAATVLGSRTWYVLTRHLIPGVLPPVIVAATLLVSEAILLEAALSFLGAGVRPPQPSWGNMLTEAQSITVLSSMPWLWIPAGLTIACTVLAAMAIGDGLRDALDPKRNR